VDNLSPWETTEEDSDGLVRFCEKILPPLMSPKPVQYQTHHLKVKEQKPESINRPKSYALEETPQKNISHRLFESTKKKNKVRSHKKTSRGHEAISIKKFLMEGGLNNKENLIAGRRRESAFVLKQKFAEIGKSVRISPFSIQPIHYSSFCD
jgi:hypothetical protein